MRTFVDLAEKLRMPVEDLMRQCNGHAPPSKALVKGLARELDINESYLDKLAEEVRKDLVQADRLPRFRYEAADPISNMGRFSATY
jgi:hypothetical protein